jgi:hypothetical protein
MGDQVHRMLEQQGEFYMNLSARLDRIEAKLDRLLTPMLTDAEAKARIRALFARYYGERD